jgi:hypothetical protein
MTEQGIQRWRAHIFYKRMEQAKQGPIHEGDDDDDDDDDNIYEKVFGSLQKLILRF